MQKRTQLTTGLALVIQPAPQPLPASRRMKPPNPWVMPLILERGERGCYRTLLTNLIQTDISGYQNFIRMPPAFFDLTEECIHHRMKKSVPNIRKPLRSCIETGNNSATLGNRRDLHIFAILLTRWPSHHL